MKLSLCIIHLLLIPLLAISSSAKDNLAPNSDTHRKLIESSKKILILGDSITYSGSYVTLHDKKHLTIKNAVSDS